MSQPDNLLKADGIKNQAQEKMSELSNEPLSLNKTEESKTPEKETILSQQETPNEDSSINETEENKTAEKEEVIESKLANETDEADTVLNEIEASNAEDAEDTGNQERHTIEQKDYHEMSLETLVLEIEKLVKNEKVQAIKKHVDDIKNEFNLKFNALLEEKKQDFISKGGNEIDFRFNSPLQRSFKDTYNDFRSKLSAHYKNLEKNLKDNLSNRLEIIEEIKRLMNDTEDSINTKYKQFKALQERWKSAGPIPRDKYNNAWNSYHFNVEKFYDLLHLDRDLRDKDFQHNLEKKTKIIERAEELAEDNNTNRAFRELQVLHKLWKEDLGPVAKEYREVIWERFKAATKKINDKRQEYFLELDAVYEKNLERKNEIIEAIKAKANEAVSSHSGWQNKINEIEALRDQFFKAGKVPIKLNEATWANFKDAVRAFNHKKNGFYKNLKKDQFENLNKKLALIKIAEDNKDSDDFEVTTPLMKKIQNDWKQIGHVPRKESDKIWKQFKAACNGYFDRINEQRNAASEEEETLVKKEAILAELKDLKLSGDQKADLATIKEYINKWKGLGRVPYKKRKVEASFNKTLDSLFKDLDLNKSDAEMIKFENKLQDLSNAEDSRVLDNERSFIRKKVEDIKSEINQLENNLQFFKHADESNPLVKSVHTSIKRHKDDLSVWQNKLKKIKELY